MNEKSVLNVFSSGPDQPQQERLVEGSVTIGKNRSTITHGNKIFNALSKSGNVVLITGFLHAN
jgi:hypothetical protein